MNACLGVEIPKKERFREAQPHSPPHLLEAGAPGPGARGLALPDASTGTLTVLTYPYTLKLTS